MQGLDYINTKRFATQAQLDDGTRMQMASFFGNPDAREFVDNAGGIQGAAAQLGAAPNIGPGPDPNSPGSPVDMGVMGNGFTPVHPSQPPADAAAAPANPTAISSATFSPSNYSALNTAPGAGSQPQTGPLSREDFLKQNPSAAPMSARPVVDMDQVHGARKGLMMAFLALNKFGAGLDHQQNSYADEFYGNAMRQRQAQLAYDQNAPTMQRAAQDKAYNEYLTQQHGAAAVKQAGATTEHTQAETDVLRGGMSPQRMQINEKLRELSGKASSEWQTGKWAQNPEGFKRAVRAQAQGLPPQEVESMLNDMTNVPLTGSKYDVWNESGVPVGLKTKDGRLIPAASIPSLNDPSADTAWQAGQQGHTTSVKEKNTQAQLSAQYRGQYNRTVMLTNNKTGMQAAFDPMDAQRLSQDPKSGWSGGINAGVSQARGQHAIMADVIDTANQVHMNLPNRPLDRGEIAQIATAVNDPKTTAETMWQSEWSRGMKPDAAQLTASILGLRDNIMALSGQFTKGSATDVRIQALWNAMPNAADLSNPNLAQQKMKNAYRMMYNLRKALPADAGTLGVENAPDIPPNMVPSSAHPQNSDAPNTFGTFMKNNKKKPQ